VIRLSREFGNCVCNLLHMFWVSLFWHIVMFWKVSYWLFTQSVPESNGCLSRTVGQYTWKQCVMYVILPYQNRSHISIKISNIKDSRNCLCLLCILCICHFSALLTSMASQEDFKGVTSGRFFEGGGSTNSIEDRGQRERGSGDGSPLVRCSTQFSNEWNRYSD
jgi:hypothetical protein